MFISTSQQWLDRFEDVRFQGLQGMNARKILLMIGIMAAHASGEGAGVGVSFCGTRGWAQARPSSGVCLFTGLQIRTGSIVGLKVGAGEGGGLVGSMAN